MYCLLPDENSCENFVTSGEICLGKSKLCLQLIDEERYICINILSIAIAIIIGNILQLVFEAGMLYAMEVTFKPTNLDKLEDPEKF